ncbi:hypothetical protein WJX72_011229 [[Myrmecia] bisecta]|uniref:Uncharacterized protein n=1 Tax=[Myrmecia] bisecta TaxID=41462 RepID=A0AAW1QSW5_9CHLO
MDDPDSLSLLFVQQWLQERGYSSALAALEKEVGLKYVDTKLERGSMLMGLVYSHMEQQAAAVDGVESDVESAAEEERLLQGGAQDFPNTCMASLEGLHASSVIAVCCWPGQSKAITGSGDGNVRLFTFDGELLWQTPVGGGGVLSLDLHPNVRQGDARLLAGSMDGSVTLLDGMTGNVLHTLRPHTKYCVRMRWSPEGAAAASCSWDHSMAVYSCPATTSEAGGSEALVLRKHHPYASQVQDVEFLQDGKTLAVALKQTNYLRLFDTESLQDTGRVNMNAFGDDHVSFSASHLALSPCRQYLLVSTDGARIIMFRCQGWELVRNFYGLPIEQFHQPCATWHRSGFYVMAAAAAGHVYVMHVGSAKVVANYKAHAKNVRSLHYDGDQNVLVTCSFDKNVKVYGYRSQVQ